MSASAQWHAWARRRAEVRRRRGVLRHADPPAPPALPAVPGVTIDLASNDYLGLRDHRRVRAAAQAQLRRSPLGAGASRVVAGTHPVHRELESRVAALAGARDALVLSSGYMANLGVLQALGGPRTTVLIDAHIHASLRDGAALSGARVETMPHRDHGELSRRLRGIAAERPGERIAVVVESVYSVLGDGEDLAAVAEICGQVGAMLIVDEAHTLGTCASGTWSAAAGLLHDRPPEAGPVLVTASLGKALGSQGGVVLFSGTPESAALWREHLVNTARTVIFDTALSPSVAAGAAEACRLAAESTLGADLQRSRSLLIEILSRRPLVAAHLECGAAAVHAIRMPDAASARAAADELAALGVAVGCFRPPSVPDGAARLRLSLSAAHRPIRLRAALELVADVVERAHGGPQRCPFETGDPRPSARRADHRFVEDPDQVRRILASPQTFAASNALTAVVELTPQVRRRLAAARFRLPPVLASASGAEHLRVRRIVAGFFSPARVSAQHDHIRRSARQEAAALPRGEVVDLAATVAAVVPARIMSALTGVPNPPEDRLHRWSADSLELFWGWPDPERQHRLVDSAIGLHRWLTETVEAAGGGEDLFSALRDGGVETEKIVSLGYFLIIAGQETTRMLIASALDAGLLDRRRWAQCADASQGRQASRELVTEVLTRRSSVPTWKRRALADAAVADLRVDAGEELLLRLSGGEHTDHRMAFGHGVHRCLGAGLAQAEAELVVHEIARAMPDAVAVGPPPTWYRLLSFQCPHHVLVQVP